MDFSQFELEASLTENWSATAERFEHGVNSKPTMAIVSSSLFSEPAAPDVPAAIGRMILWSYALMMVSLLLFFGTSVEAAMMAIICAFYTAIYLGVPAALLVVERRSGGRTMEDFLAHGLATAAGPISGKEAIVQILLIPVAITAAIVVIGTAAALIL